jgi:ubiquitin thioesterase protein OTUB1
MDSASIEAIKNQERLIEKEIADRIPFVGPKIPIEELKTDYQPDDEIYQKKIQYLEKDYAFLRRTRPDGNCFFRAFGFAYFESLLNDDNQDELDKFIKFTKTSKDELINLGLPSVTIEDFFDVFLEVLMNIKEKQIENSEQLLERFCEQTISDYIVVYFRLITSGYLQQNEDKFANFLIGTSSIVDFCKTEVEPMYRESDHIHVVAITSAIQVKIRIVYMDRADGSVNAHDFPEPQDHPTTSRVHLLYRPGHYDVLYLR